MSDTSNERITEPPGTVDLTESAWHRLLEAEERRIILDILADATPPLDLTEIAKAITQHLGSSNVMDAETVERVAVSLHHHHLPKMATFGVLEYDSSTNQISESCLDASENGSTDGL